MLVVNDDGVYGAGLKPLVAALRPLGQVTVVVPDQERSTASHALTVHRPIRVRALSPGFYIVNGLPSDCARFGILELLKEKVDLVVSGINQGLNIGDDTLYSGTVAAAMEGTLLGLPAIALSQDMPCESFAPAARFAAKLARRVLREGLPGGTCLSVNFPSAAPWKGVEVARLCRRDYGRKVHTHKDPRGSVHYWLTGDNISSIGGKGSDGAVIESGKVAITPLKVDMTDEAMLPALRKWKLAALLGLFLATGGIGSARAASTGTLTFVAVGDIRLDGAVGSVVSAEGAAAPLAAVAESLKGDILFGNLECPITTRGEKVEKTWNFRAKPAALAAISSFTVVSVANNHTVDFGVEGLLDTLKHVRKRGLTPVGAGKDRAHAEKPVFFTRRGLKVGVLAFTSTFPKEAWAKDSRPGVAYSDFQRFPEIISGTRKLCDVLVVSFHGGTELDAEPNELQRAFAHAAIDAGADIVIGHHPHVLQPVEAYKGKPILYSLGNFLFLSPNPETWWTAIARIELGSGGVRSLSFVPVRIGAGRLSPGGEEGESKVREKLDKWGAWKSLGIL